VNGPKKILIISGVFPSINSPQLGSFVKESSEILQEISNAEIFYAVSTRRPYNQFMVFLKHISIIIRSIIICVKHRPHFIISHTLFPIGFEALIIAKLFNLKLVSFAHGGDIYGMSKNNAILWQKDKMNYLWRMRFSLIKIVVQKTIGIIYVSDYLFLLAKKYFKAKENKSLISPIGFNPQLFYNNKAIQSRPKEIMYIGRLDSKKGIFKLFTILSSISEYLNDNNYTVNIIGRIEDKKFVDIYYENKNIYNVKYLGEKNREELQHYFNSARLTIVPSFYEAFGLVAVESIACGTPVACFPVGGLKEVIKDRYNGIYLDLNNDEKSGQKIKLLLNNMDLLKKYSNNSILSAQKYNIYQTHRNIWLYIKNIYSGVL